MRTKIRCLVLYECNLIPPSSFVSIWSFVPWIQKSLNSLISIMYSLCAPTKWKSSMAILFRKHTEPKGQKVCILSWWSHCGNFVAPVNQKSNFSSLLLPKWTVQEVIKTKEGWHEHQASFHHVQRKHQTLLIPFFLLYLCCWLTLLWAITPHLGLKGTHLHQLRISYENKNGTYKWYWVTGNALYMHSFYPLLWMDHHRNN